jgi:hypothetical protein
MKRSSPKRVLRCIVWLDNDFFIEFSSCIAIPSLSTKLLKASCAHFCIIVPTMENLALICNKICLAVCDGCRIGYSRKIISRFPSMFGSFIWNKY